MLRRTRFLPALLALLAAPIAGAAPRRAPGSLPSAGDGEPARSIYEPVRLTAGASSDLMGVLSADERTLYFVSDASGTLDILRQAPVQSGPAPFSSGLGDAAWPELSPDGKHLAYVSFENDSTGDACVRPIGEDGEAGEERCLTDGTTSELQVAWWNRDTLAVLMRRELHGDFALWSLPLAGGEPTPLARRNMVGVAVSPDRRWLAYIPLTKRNPNVGITFAQRTGTGIGLERLDGASGEREPVIYVPPLPGVSGSVAFSRDGASLYFTQFLNDTNGDGQIDGNDHAVIFRVPFDGAKREPVARAEPEQLTSARWDCHYPAPSEARLVASCSHEGSLDIYSLPLTGAVPREWDDARLEGEAKAARDLWTRLLIASRRLALAPSPAKKEPILREMIGLHLELGEHASAIYYAEQRLTSEESRAYGKVLAELARHRTEDLALIRGETSEPYVQSERARAAALRAFVGTASPAVDALARLAISEIQDDIGDKATALATFRAIELGALRDPLAISLAARRAERLYRLRAERAALLEVYRTFAGLEALDVSRRLVYAERFKDELLRGRSRADRAAALDAQLARTDPEGELGLLLQVEKELLPLDDATQESVRARLFELYQDNKDPERRRAMVLSVLRTAARAGNEYLSYQFVTSWASSVRRASPERKYAEALYDSIVLERAYGEGRQGKLGEARGYFYGATVATDSLEAHIGFIEARHAEGGSDPELAIDQAYERRFAREPDSPVLAFVRAYRIARTLPTEEDAERHEERASEAITLLARALAALPKERHIHQVWGFVLHQRARRTGSRQAAVDANRQYLLALDLSRNDERLTASLLHRLGLLQASLGNHGAALRYYQRRDALPHVRPLAELGLRVALARSAWHTGDAELAKAQMLAASALLEKRADAARFTPLVLDRLALSLWLAGDHEAARDRYAELARLVGDDAAPLNRLKAEVGTAANALSFGDAEAALAALARADRLLEDERGLEPPEDPYRRSLIGGYNYSPLQYRALVAGLRAGAAQALGDVPAALAATEARVRLLSERLEESDVDEDRLELAQAYHHLARLHHRSGDARAAARAVEAGLALSDRFNENTGSEVNEAELALVRDYAELYLYGGLPRSEMQRDLGAALDRVYTVICQFRNPRWSEHRFLFSTYLTDLALRATPPPAEGVAHDDRPQDPAQLARSPVRARLR